MHSKLTFHHVGLACRSIEAEVESLTVLGFSPEGSPVVDPIQKVRVQFFVGAGPRIELIEPTAPDSPVQAVLKRGGKLYHLAYEVSDFDGAIKLLESRDFHSVGPAAPAVAFEMRRIIFLMSRTLTLVELIEAPT